MVAPRRWYLLVWLAGAAMAGLGLWHGQHGFAAAREWRRWRTADPSLADFFLTELEIELALTIGCLVVAFLIAAVAKRQWKTTEGR